MEKNGGESWIFDAVLLTGVTHSRRDTAAFGKTFGVQDRYMVFSIVQAIGLMEPAIQNTASSSSSERMEKGPGRGFGSGRSIRVYDEDIFGREQMICLGSLSKY